MEIRSTSIGRADVPVSSCETGKPFVEEHCRKDAFEGCCGGVAEKFLAEDLLLRRVLLGRGYA